MDEKRYQYLSNILNKRSVGSYASWYIYADGHKKDEDKTKFLSAKFWLGIRTHDMSGTDHERVVRITKEEARDLERGSSFLFPIQRISTHFVNWDLEDEPLPVKDQPTFDNIKPGFWYFKTGAGLSHTIVKVEVVDGKKVVYEFGSSEPKDITTYDYYLFLEKVGMFIR